MLKTVLLAGAMTIAAPALAQTQATPVDPVPVTDAQPAPTAAVPAKTSAKTAPSMAAPAAAPASAADGKVAQTAPTAKQPVLGETAATTTPADATATTAPADVAAAAPADAAAAPAEVATAAPADKATQVAEVVNSEFPTYDKDSSGSLSSTEFGSWMVALKTAADPATKADSPAVKTWIGQAFASADTDKNKAVSKTELEGFLSKGG